MKSCFQFPLLLFLLLSLNTANGQVFNKWPDNITWTSNYKLKWTDFKAIPDSNSSDLAITATIVGYEILPHDSTFTVKVYCEFVKQLSWSRAKDNVNVLKHEQGHFDIAELFARKFRKALKNRKMNLNTVYQVTDSILANILIEKKKFNDLYDTETEFSNNLKKQAAWNKKILTELNKLNIYKN